MAKKKIRREDAHVRAARRRRRFAQQQEQDQNPGEVNDLQAPPVVTAEIQQSSFLRAQAADENAVSPASAIVTESAGLRMPTRHSDHDEIAVGNLIHGISFLAEDSSDSTMTNTANNSLSNGQAFRDNISPRFLTQNNFGAPSQENPPAVQSYLHPYLATSLEILPASNLLAMDPAQQNLSHSPKEEDTREATTSPGAAQNVMIANMEKITPEAEASNLTDASVSQNTTIANMEKSPEAETPQASDEGGERPKIGYSFKFSEAEAADAKFLTTEVNETAPEKPTEQKANGKGKGKVKGKGNQKAEAENSSDNADLVTAMETLAVNNAEGSSADDETKRKKAELKEAMFRALDQGDSQLWENTVGWDVLIQCRGYSWRVHRYILCELSPTWMAKYIPPAEKGKAYTVWTLDSHQPEVLGTVLRFMYKLEFEHGDMDPQFPLETGCIVTNVAMFIAGASVMCRDMMDMAVDNIEDITETVENIAPTLAHIDVDSFQEPVHRALLIMYEQPDQWLLRALRLAMSRFVTSFYGFMILNQNWAPRYKEAWSDVNSNIMHDNLYYGRIGNLRPIPPAHKELLQAAEIKAYNRIQAAQAGPQTPLSTQTFLIVPGPRAPAVHTPTAGSGGSRASSMPITPPASGIP